MSTEVRSIVEQIRQLGEIERSELKEALTALSEFELAKQLIRADTAAQGISEDEVHQWMDATRENVSRS